MQYDYVKAIHIIFIVTWFAALFYIVRLFIYNSEAQKKEEVEKKILSEQFIIMQKRYRHGCYCIRNWNYSSCRLTVPTLMR